MRKAVCNPEIHLRIDERFFPFCNPKSRWKHAFGNQRDLEKGISFFLSIYLSIWLGLIYLSIYVSIYLSIHLFIDFPLVALIRDFTHFSRFGACIRKLFQNSDFIRKLLLLLPAVCKCNGRAWLSAEQQLCSKSSCLQKQLLVTAVCKSSSCVLKIQLFAVATVGHGFLQEQQLWLNPSVCSCNWWSRQSAAQRSWKTTRKKEYLG